MYDGVARKSAPYLFLGQTTSLCETCLDLVPAKIVEEDGGIQRENVRKTYTPFCLSGPLLPRGSGSDCSRLHQRFDL